MTKNNAFTSVPQNSRYGTASFVISLSAAAIGLIALELLLLLASPAQRSVFSTSYGNFSPLATLVMAFAAFCGGPFALLVGIPLGIAGLFQKNKKKLHAMLGIVINALVVLGIAATLFVIFPLLIQY